MIIMLGILSTVFGLVCIEGFYRLYLLAEIRSQQRGATQYEEKPSAMIFPESPWVFNKDWGYDYNHGKKILQSGIGRGIVSRHYTYNITEDGNYPGHTILAKQGVAFQDHEPNDYETADLKILTFGDSFSTTWPPLLEEYIGNATGKTVAVKNFARDGYGFLQMMDIAKRKVVEYDPDLAILLFITDDLSRPRTWRAARRIRGYDRVISTTEASEMADPLTSSAMEGAVINSRVTEEWCEQMSKLLKSKEFDKISENPIYKELVAQYNELKKENLLNPVLINFRTTSTSFLVNKIRHGNPFDKMRVFSKRKNAAPLPDRLDLDPGCVEALCVLEERSKPWAIIHLPLLNKETKENKEYMFGISGLSVDHEQSLLGSLIFHKDVIGLNKYLVPMELDWDNLVNSVNDMHPNKDGWLAYAEATTQALQDKGLI